MKQVKIPVTFKADQSFFDELDRARTATPVHQTRSEFVRNAVTSYLVYFNKELLPLLKKQRREFEAVDEPLDFFAASGAQDYERWFR